MKKYLFLFMLFGGLSLKAQTTLEEYNYLTKGYKIQIESGLDMKKGYSLKELAFHRVGVREMRFFSLFRDGSPNPCAILVIYENKEVNFKDYICVPHHDSPNDIWAKYNNKLKDYSLEASLALNWGLAKVLAKFAQNN